MVVKFKNPENCREIRRVYMAVYIMYHLYYVILRALCSVISGTGKTKNYIRWTQKAGQVFELLSTQLSYKINHFK